MGPHDVTATASAASSARVAVTRADETSARTFRIATLAMTIALAVAPWVGVYPVFLMKALCFALFACAFNLLVG